MAVPQRLTLVTLGARDLPALRRFYRDLGWRETDGASDTYASFDCGSVKLALHPVNLLREEAAPGAPPPAPGTWSDAEAASGPPQPLRLAPTR